MFPWNMKRILGVCRFDWIKQAPKLPGYRIFKFTVRFQQNSRSGARNLREESEKGFC
jgi:hypothetical protein